MGCGRVDALYSGVAGEGWYPWDYAAGWLFLEEAGGVVTQVRVRHDDDDDDGRRRCHDHDDHDDHDGDGDGDDDD